MMTLLLIGIGAALMYFFDPASGRRRRAWLRDKCASAPKKQQASFSEPERSSGRVAGVGAEDISVAASIEAPTDEELARRVRSALEHALPEPSAVEVMAHQGVVILSGQVSAEAQDTLLARVRSVAGVKDVENRLEVRIAPANV